MLVTIRYRLEVRSSFIYFPLYQVKGFDSILSKQDSKSQGLGRQLTRILRKGRWVGGGDIWLIMATLQGRGTQVISSLLVGTGDSMLLDTKPPPTGSSTRRRDTLLPDNLCLHDQGGGGLGLGGPLRNHWLCFWEDSEYWESSVYKAAKVKFHRLLTVP